jgi:hypothetical protein
MKDHEIDEAIRVKAVRDPGFAIAYAILRLAAAQDYIGVQVKYLGNADAATPMGAIEALGAVIKEGLCDLAIAVDRND